MPKSVDTRFLESLIGYNARRVALVAIEKFLDRMSVFGLRPVDFSVLVLIHHNPGITSRQLCRTLNLLPPNLVGQVASFEQRGWLFRSPHPTDRRAIGLTLSEAGAILVAEAEGVVAKLEGEVGKRLTASETQTLIRLLQKIYQNPTSV